MRELLNFSKELEIDFVNQNANYQSKMDLAITSLVTGDYRKSKELFDSAIEIDSLFPSAWLGKAFSEIAIVSDEDFNSLKIDEYLNRALRTTENLTKYKVALAGCLAYRHSVIILKYTKIVESALRQQREAELQRNFALVAAVVGAVVSGKEKSIASNIVGASLITGGIGYAIHSQLEANEYSFLGNSNYRAALTQCYLSATIIHLCGTLIDKIEDKQLADAFNVVLESWKESIIYLFDKQKEQLLHKLESYNFKKAADILLLLDSSKDLQEIGEFKAFMKIIGLSGHIFEEKLDNIIKTSLKDFYQKEEEIKLIKNIAWLQENSYLPAMLLIFISFFTFLPLANFIYPNEYLWFFVIGICALLIQWYPTSVIVTNKMITCKNIFLNEIYEIDNIEIFPDDIKLNQIGN